MSGPSPSDIRDLLVRAFAVVKAVADAYVTGGQEYKVLRDDIHNALREPVPPSMTFHGPDGSAIVRVLHDMYMERRRQDEKCGGPEKDDDNHTHYWMDLIEERAAGIRKAHEDGLAPHAHLVDVDEQRRLLIQIAALAVAAVESLDRKRS